MNAKQNYFDGGYIMTKTLNKCINWKIRMGEDIITPWQEQ